MTEKIEYIIGYEGLYKISNLGRFIKIGGDKIITSGESIRIPDKEIYPTTLINSYPCIALTKDGKQKIHFAHRLMGQQWKARRLLQSNERVLHRNGDKRDYKNLDNLKLK